MTVEGALKGIKVIELAQIMAGPTCGMLLADMGADVIKVEKLPGGDDTRSYTEPSINGESAAFMILNRNKRGIAVNLKKPGGLEVVKRLLADADVVTENYRKGTSRSSASATTCCRSSIRASIYCASRATGRTGPYADKGGFDLIAQGFAGIMSITGEPGGPPAKVGHLDRRHQRRASSPRSASSRRWLRAPRPAAARWSRPRSWKPRSSRPTGSRRSSSPPARTPSPRAPRTSSPRPTRRFPTADGWINLGGAEPIELGAHRQGGRAPELAADPRFRHQRRAHEEPGRARRRSSPAC
jgi:crotonobetainyl-CoA:carnitine CoA-transferase CaiB-like acyl-CoA transferase